MADLKTNYKDDVLNTSVNTQRKYQMTNNEDGTVSFTDRTEYAQMGDTFGAADVNAISEAVNSCFQSVSDGKALVASAITDKGVSTAAGATFETMANNIGAIPKGICIYLGNGTSFNVQTLCAENGIDYKMLTNDNFITGFDQCPVTEGDTSWTYETYHTYAAKAHGCTKSHSYDASTGVLSISGYAQTVGIVQKSFNDRHWLDVTQNMRCFAYLVYTGK